jgi:hypothetical protein
MPMAVRKMRDIRVVDADVHVQPLIPIPIHPVELELDVGRTKVLVQDVN